MRRLIVNMFGVCVCVSVCDPLSQFDDEVTSLKFLSLYRFVYNYLPETEEELNTIPFYFFLN